MDAEWGSIHWSVVHDLPRKRSLRCVLRDLKSSGFDARGTRTRPSTLLALDIGGS